jgi:hypothetical protein
MKQISKCISLSVLTMFVACGGGGSSDDSVDFSGTWSGNVSVKVDAGDPVCAFFGGEYPISWTFNKKDSESYDVVDYETSIGTLEVSEGNKGTVHFPSTHNFIPEAELDCHGWETVTITKDSETSVTWDYVGAASCGTKATCEYSGTAKLNN